MGGGRVLSLENPQDAKLFDRAGLPPAVAREPLWQWLLIAGMALYLLDAASRRVAWDRFLGNEFGSNVRKRAAALTAARGGAAIATVDKLRRHDSGIEQRLDAPAATGGLDRLSTDDARAIIKAEAERRKQARAAAKLSLIDI